MKRYIYLILLLCCSNALFAQGGKIYTGVTSLTNTEKSIHPQGESQNGYVIGFEGVLSEGFSPVFGAKYSAVKLQSSKSWNHFAGGDKIDFFSGYLGFIIPVVKVTEKISFDTQITGIFYKVIDYDLAKMREIHNELINEVMGGVSLSLILNIDSVYISIDGETHFNDAFSVEGSRYRVTTLKAGYSF